MVVDTSSVVVFNVCSRKMSSQPKDVILVTIVNTFWVIWHCRNKIRFDDIKVIRLKAAVNLIIANTALTGNLSSGSISASIDEFVMLKSFSLTYKPCKAPIIKQVNWFPPLCNWIKCNSDGAAKGSLGIAGCGGIFGDKSTATLGCFACNIGISFAFNAELVGAMIAIETAHKKVWINFWLECDSSLVMSAFKSPNIVPWKLRNRWENCLHVIKGMNFIYSHIYREGNTCENKLVSFGTSIQGLVWWDLIPSFISEDFYHKRLGLPNYRFK